MTRNAFRIDVLPRTYNKAIWPSWADCDAYKVPCGMTSIAYIGSTYARTKSLQAIASQLQDSQVAVASKWDDKLSDYVVYDVFDKNDYVTS